MVALEIGLDDDWIAAHDGVTGPSHVDRDGRCPTINENNRRSVAAAKSHNAPSSSLKASIDYVTLHHYRYYGYCMVVDDGPLP